MPKQPKTLTRLGVYMDRRRSELGMKWGDVLAASGLSDQTLLTARTKNATLLGLTKARIEKALQWEPRSEEHTSELQSRENLVCRLLLEKKKNKQSNERVSKEKNRHIRTE